MAVPTFISASAIGNSTAGSFSITVPISPAHQADDILLVISWYRASATVLTPTGYTEAATALRGTTRYYTHWKRATSGAEADPLFDYTGTDDGFGLMCVYRGVRTTGNPYDVLGAFASGTAEPATLTEITTLVANALVVALIGGEDNTGTGMTMTATNPAAFTEHYAESPTGTDGAVALGEAERVTAGATGNISAAFGATVVGWGGWVLSLVAPTSVLNFQTLSVVELSVVALAGLLQYFRTLSAVEVSVASLSRVVNYFRTLSVVEVSVIALSALSTYLRTLAVVEISVTSLTTAKIFVKTLATTAISVASLSTQKIFGVVMSVVETSIVTLNRSVTFFKTLATIELSVVTLFTKGISLTLKNAANALVINTLVKWGIFEYGSGTPSDANWMSQSNKGTDTTTSGGVLQVPYSGTTAKGGTVYVAVIQPDTSPTQSMVWTDTIK